MTVEKYNRTKVTLENKTILLIIAWTVFTAVTGAAQTGGTAAYSGGAGDGYAMAELELQPLFTTVSVTELAVRPNIAGPSQIIRLPHGIVPEQGYLTGTNGVRYHISPTAVSGSDLVVPQVPDGLYILRFDTANGSRYHAKIVVVQH